MRNMQKQFHYILCAVLLICFSACQSGPPGFAKKDTLDVRTRINAACYEVVAKKPKTDSLVYEKELPWELIDFNIRNDQYWPLGTAFAVSDRELVTASHVLEFMNDTEHYSEMYIRDATGNVYPIDQVLSFHEARDFVKFTVKDKTFDIWFDLRASYALNEPIYAVGNIYGQGLVAVPGTLLGTLPESENGQWLYLKSSPPNDSGSSGGPLLDRNGNVIGVIIAKDNNFSYSLPVGEMEKVPQNIGVYHRQFSYRFHLFPEKNDFIPFDQEVSLPKHYQGIKRIINRRFTKQYCINMDKLFEKNRDGIFPRGNASLVALDDSCNDYGVQVLYKDRDDGTWYFSDFEKEHSSLGKNGSVQYANTQSMFFVDLVKPDDVALNDLYDNPRLAMDLILRGINLPRKFAEQDIRILSLGEPSERDTLRDAYGRKWLISLWSIEYSDEACILVSAPTPDGLICLLKFVTFGQQRVWMYDLKKTLDFVYVPYFGTLEQWSEFLGQNEYLYGTFLKTKLSYKANEYLHLTAGDVQIDFDTKLLKITDRSKLSLMHDFYPVNGKAVWGMRKIVYTEEKSENYFTVYRHIKPHPELPDSYKKYWHAAIQKGHPYNEVPFAEEGRTNAGFVHPKYTSSAKGSLEHLPWIHTVYVGKEGSIPAAQMKSDLKMLKREIKIN